MRRLTLRISIAIITFTIGIAAASLWLIQHRSVPISKSPEEHYPQLVTIKFTADTIAQDRDLSLYDRGGKFGCGGVWLKSEDGRCRASIVRARAFIWKHWQEQKRGYVIVSLGSEDAQSDSHIFIEPDESGAWHVVWRIDRVFAMEHSGEIDDVPDIRSIEQRRAGKYDNEPSGTSILVFRDRNGKEIETL
jgi:hypothetical protein